VRASVHSFSQNQHQLKFERRNPVGQYHCVVNLHRKEVLVPARLGEGLWNLETAGRIVQNTRKTFLRPAALVACIVLWKAAMRLPPGAT
jgi:hypothetical protein